MIVALGERECSIQRRHQKVIEESPSPAVTPDLRQQLYAAAVTAAQRAGYMNAGTVEFLLDQRGEFYFLEMNTRLQVEHPVTEAVTGRDLVRLQLEIAAGQPLPFTQADVTLSGHAIECRVYAEDPEHDYLPQTGTITVLAEPDIPGLRIDGSLYAGAAVTPYYDPLLAKVITHGATRDETIARMQDALAGYRITGIVTNLPQLRAILATDAFRAGETHTGFLTEHWHPGETQAIPEEILLAIAGYEATRRRWPNAGITNPWQSVGPLRFGSAAIRGVYTVNGISCTVEATRDPDSDGWHIITPQPEGNEQLRRGGHAEGTNSLPSTVRFDRPTPDRLLIRRNAETIAVTIRGDDADNFTLLWQDEPYRIARVGLPSPEEIMAGSDSGAAGASDLTAPLTGIVARVLVGTGDQVKARQPLIVLEAMKMEHTIAAPAPARVRAIHAAQGDRVTGGTVLVELEAE
jgi:3-methylcrotonyl-CoA carboxylase alpha subunit